MNRQKAAFGLGLGILLGLAPFQAYAGETQDGGDAGQAAEVAIDETNFPDAIFRQYVLDSIDGDKDGSLSGSEISVCWMIDVSNQGIQSLEGIEIFSDLRWLYCSQNQLSSLEVSGNAALEGLSCGNNQLSSLDVSGNVALTELWCFDNQLSSLDVSGNVALTELWCSDNQLSSLDVSGNAALEYLHCENNQLSSLDVSGCTALTELYCENNQLSSLDVSGCTTLTELRCANNQLSSLAVSRNTALTILYCENNQLSSLDVNGCTALTGLWCYKNQLSSLDVSRNAALTDLRCANNQLSSLDVSGNAALEILYCYDNQLSSLEVSGNAALELLYCSENQLSSLEVSGNAALADLRCASNQLSSLDVSGNAALIWLDCYNNQLSSLDVSGCTGLTYFDASWNTLTTETNLIDMLQYDKNFDASKVSDTTGCSFDGSVLTFNENTGEASYIYDCGQGKTMEVAVRRTDVWQADITDISVPAAGETPDTEGLVSFAVSSAAGTIESITWSPATEGAFGYGTAYTASINVSVGGGYLFTEETVATVNWRWAAVALNGDGTITVSFTFPATEDKVVEKEFSFTDVDKAPGNWKYDSVKYVNDRSIMGGVGGSNEFQPDSTLTRAMFATVLYRMAGQPAVAYSGRFTDVPEGQWYSNAILWANEKGIVSGYTDGSYGINDNITREQIAKMLCIFGETQGHDVSARASLGGFTDASEVSGWAVGYMQWAVDAGMISGKPNGDGSFRLDPRGQATRAECAKMLMMFSQKYNIN